MEEIYTFAGWMPHTWLDPSNKAKSDSSSEAKVSASNSQYQTTSLLPSSTPLGWNNRVTEDDDTKRRRDDHNADQIEAIRQTMLMDTGGSTMMPSSDDTSSGAQMDSQTAQQDDAELIPRSMSDIYKISIQNRNKRDNNKSNGAVNDQEDVVEDENLQDVDVDDETPMFPNSTAKSSAEESDVVFMTRLGWVEQGTEMYGRVKRAEASGKGGVGGGDGEKDGKKKSRRTNRSSKKKAQEMTGAAMTMGSLQLLMVLDNMARILIVFIVILLKEEVVEGEGELVERVDVVDEVEEALVGVRIDHQEVAVDVGVVDVMADDRRSNIITYIHI